MTYPPLFGKMIVGMAVFRHSACGKCVGRSVAQLQELIDHVPEVDQPSAFL
jgi:hypothetical protein